MARTMTLLERRLATTEQLFLVMRPRDQEVPGGLNLGVHCSECSQFQADSFISLLLGLSFGPLSRTIDSVITGPLDICSGCISFLSGPLCVSITVSLRS